MPLVAYGNRLGDLLSKTAAGAAEKDGGVFELLYFLRKFPKTGERLFKRLSAV